MINVNAYACIIVETDGFPTRISVGELVSLQREPVPPLEPGVVAAYYGDEKVGYLSSDSHALWDILEPSARQLGKVIGEILDENGGLAALDIEFNLPGGNHELTPMAACQAAETTRWIGKTLTAIIGPTVFLLAMLAELESIGPVGHIPAVSAVANKQLPLIAPPGTVNALGNRTIELAQVARLSLSDQVKHMSMLNVDDRIVSKDVASNSADQMQAQELNRIVQQAGAYRLAQDLNRRAKAARQTQINTQQLVEDLHQARETVARQRSRLDWLEKSASQTAVHWQAENGRLESNITLLRRRIEELLAARQQLAKEEEKQPAFRELNQEELVRYKNRMMAWTLANRQQTRQVEDIKRTQRKVLNPDPKAAVVVKADKPTKKRVKANFSRYAQENRDSNKGQLKSGYP
jgi:hypothetical protein